MSHQKPFDLRLTRRRFLMTSAAVLAATELTGMPVAHAESAFTFGTLGGSWGEGLTTAFAIMGKFTEQTKLPVQNLNGPYPILISRILAQPNNPPWTVADLLDIEHFMAADAGVIQDYDLDIVTNYADVFDSAKHPPRNGLNHWCASFTVPIISLGYNSKHVDKPTSWEDMWNPKYKGKIAIPDFGWYGQTWLHAINKQLGGDESDVSKGIQAASDLIKKNGAIVLKTTEQAIKAFESEQIVMMPYWNGRVSMLQEAGVPVEMAYVPGTIQIHNGLVIARNTKYTREANIFVNNALNGELQLELTRRFKYPPSNSKAMLPPDLEQFRVTHKELDAVVPLNWAAINENRVSTLDRWNREVLS